MHEEAGPATAPPGTWLPACARRERSFNLGEHSNRNPNGRPKTPRDSRVYSLAHLQAVGRSATGKVRTEANVTTTSQQLANETAYRNLKRHIDQTYPKGWFVAVCEGRVAADAATLDELLLALRAAGKDAKECLAVQAGVEYREHAVIL